MSYIGNTSTTQSFTPAIDYFSGNGSTTAFTLSRPVASVAQVQVVIDNVAQNPSAAYTVSANTITFTSAPLSGTNNIYVYYTSPITQVIAPGQGTVNSTSLASSTGSGAVVLATSPTVTTPTLASANITTALTLTGASGTSGQALTSGGSGVAPTWTTIGASVATATTLGTVYGKQTTSGGTPFLTAYGYNAGVNSTGTGCTAVGVNALTTTITGTNLTAIGYLALQSSTTGSDNVAIGNSALKSITTGGENVAIGSEALMNYTGSGNSTAVGNNALRAATTGSNNTAVGWYALRSASTSSGNTAIGYNAMQPKTTGDNNTAVGTSAGASLITGIGSTYIGANVDASSSSANNELVVGTGGGPIGKGTSTAYISANGGGTYNGANSSSWATTSDRRLKKNIVDNAEGLDIVNQIRVRNFEYRTAEEVTELPSHTVIDKQGVQLGVIAQELQEVCPDCVKEESTGVLRVDSDNVFWHMVNAIKDLKTLNDSQAETINALTARIEALENR